MRQTFQWFRDHDVELPANPIQGTQLVWKIPTQSLVRDLLCNPFYAGAYVWGRRPVATVLAEGRLEKRQGATRRAEDCRVFIPDHHVGYIDWATYEENQKMIRRNSVNWQGDESMAAIRAGQGLLAGLLRCGHDEETKQRERFLIAAPPDLGESVLYAKERRLVEMVQSEAKNRRAVQIYATYKQNVT